MKKVLLIGPDCFGYNKSIASAFDPEFYKVLTIDYAEQYGQINLLNKISYFISRERLKATSRLLQDLNKYILNTYHEVNPEIVLIIKGNVLAEETISEMQGSKKILWMLDGISFYPQSLKLAELMDTVFLFEKTDSEIVRKINKNCYYLPIGFDSDIYKKLPLKKDIDLLFIGTLYPSRIRLLQKIKKEFPGLKMKVYCERFRFYKTPSRYLRSLFDKVFINKFVTPHKANILYNRSRICLNMHHEQSIYGINPRFFEIIGSDGYQLVDHKPFFQDYYPEYQSNTYCSEEELIMKIGWYLKNGERTDSKIHEEVRNYHTYRNRIEFILEKIQSA